MHDIYIPQHISKPFKQMQRAIECTKSKTLGTQYWDFCFYYSNDFVAFFNSKELILLTKFET
jgi:hypothetical protein